jgi:hypothetical protein
LSIAVLNFAIINETRSRDDVIIIGVSPDATVGEVKGEVFQQISSDCKGVHARMLILYKFKSGRIYHTPWSAFKSYFENPQLLSQLEELHPFASFSDVGLSTPNTQEVHIIVRLPSA